MTPVPHPAIRSAGSVAVLVAAGLAAGAVLAGCTGGGPPTQAVFHVQPGVAPRAAERTCQLHQTDPPTSGYRGGQASEPTLELPFLAYFRANGDKPYCDGKPPTGTDKEWARLYVELTGNASAVRGILGG